MSLANCPKQKSYQDDVKRQKSNATERVCDASISCNALVELVFVHGIFVRIDVIGVLVELLISLRLWRVITVLSTIEKGLLFLLIDFFGIKHLFLLIKIILIFK